MTISRTFYELLSVAPTASADEIKRAFRSEIARYHPDKVQHLGQEFQAMAAARAAALTEAYRTLMDPELRAEYDHNHASAGIVDVDPSSPPAASDAIAARGAPVQSREAPSPRPPDRPEVPPRFASEQRDRDEYIRKVTLDRFRKALAAELGAVEELPTADGFDLDCVARTRKVFSRDPAQRFAVRLVAFVDAAALRDAWNAAQRTAGATCVFLVGSGLAPIRELGAAVAESRRRARGNATVCVIPIDIGDWTAHIPTDAPAVCKAVLKHLRERASHR